MKKIKRTFSLFAVIFLCISVLVLPASAATAAQDHLDVVFTTDKTGYEEDDDISVSLSVTNTGDKAINNVSLQNLLPDGYQNTDA